jgi:Prenyltransferase and squalene oxidase repeat
MPPLPKVTPSARPAQPVNAGFEDTRIERCPRTWTCRATGRPHPAANADFAQSGKRALRIEVAGAGDHFSLTSSAMPALPHRTYSASVWRRSSAAGPAGGEAVRLLFYDRRHRLIGSQSNRAGTPKKDVWEPVAAKADAPAGASSVEVEISVVGPDRTVWLDTVSVRTSPILEVWGGTGIRRGPDADTLALQVTTPTPGGVHIGTLDAFGEHLLVTGPGRLGTAEGTRLSYDLQGAARYNPATSTIQVRPGEPATIHLSGRFTPTPGTGFPRVVLGDPVAQAEFAVFVAARNFAKGEGGVKLPSRVAARNAVERVSGYLESRQTADGGWAVSHQNWPGRVREDPMAIASITQGYLKRAQSSTRAKYEAMARRGLEWLVGNQRPDGGFGLPWEFGAADGHFGEPSHYADGSRTHPAGTPFAILTVAGASAMLEGFKVYGDARYLAGAVRAMDYLLRGPYGFQWLDAEHTRGSIPYCNLEPLLAPDDRRIGDHHVLSAVRNTAVDIYNIDGSALSFLKALYVETGDKRLLSYGDAIATNLARQVRADGSIAYSWYERSPWSGGYANIVFSGLLEYGEMRGRADWVARAGRGFSWMANFSRGDLVPTDGYASVYGLNLSADIAAYVTTAIQRQKPNGSFSGGTATRHDAVMFAILSDLLLDVGG